MANQNEDLKRAKSKEKTTYGPGGEHAKTKKSKV